MIRHLIGDCRDVLTTLPDASVQCCVTSPPYWGLRDYGTATWEGGDAACEHKRAIAFKPDATSTLRTKANANGNHAQEPYRDSCPHCGATRVDQQLGLERTPDEYVAKMVEVFREVRRVMRDDATLWLNLGDSYATGAGKVGNAPGGGEQGERWKDRGAITSPNRMPIPGLKPKDLVGIPWRVAFALQADGWYLRSEIIWAKPNPMPESVTDRPTKAHEQIFLLSKQPTYYYDAAAIAEEGVEPERQRADRIGGSNGHTVRHSLGSVIGSSPTRNRRSVWTVATQPYTEAHFATFPPKLIEPCVLAGSSNKACEHCGAAWVRVVERTPMVIDRSERTHEKGRTRSSGTMLEPPTSKTLGFEPGCPCPNNTGAARSVVLDPFGGAGTTGLVADRLGRDAILIELNPAYAQLSRDRIAGDSPLFAEVI